MSILSSIAESLGIGGASIRMTLEIVNAITDERHAASKEFLNWGRSNFGSFYFPIIEFELRKNVILANTPELTDEHAATITYFAMLADTPQPTSDKIVFIPNWSESDSPLEILSSETNKFEPYGDLPVSSYVSEYEVSTPSTAYYYMRNANKGVNENPEFDARFVPVKNVYLNQVKKLQSYLSKLGLYGGVKKVLAEEERKRQSERASAQEAIKAAAIAKAKLSLDLSKATTEEDRIEAAKNLEKAENDYKKGIEKELKLREELNKLSFGLDPDQKSESDTNYPLLIAGGLLLYKVLRG